MARPRPRRCRGAGNSPRWNYAIPEHRRRGLVASAGLFSTSPRRTRRPRARALVRGAAMLVAYSTMRQLSSPFVAIEVAPRSPSEDLQPRLVFIPSWRMAGRGGTCALPSFGGRAFTGHNQASNRSHRPPPDKPQAQPVPTKRTSQVWYARLVAASIVTRRTLRAQHQKHEAHPPITSAGEPPEEATSSARCTRRSGPACKPRRAQQLDLRAGASGATRRQPDPMALRLFAAGMKLAYDPTSAGRPSGPREGEGTAASPMG